MLVEVALPIPLPKTFTYRVPGGGAQPGTRVRVAFGPRKLMGWIVGYADAATEVSRIRDVDALLENEPSLAPDVLELCRWVSDYYVLPLGQVLRTALPAVLGGGVQIDEPAKTRRVVRLTRELPSLQERDDLFKRAQRQRELYEMLETLGGSDDVAHLTTQLGFSHAIVKGLVARELATFVDERIERDPFAAMPVLPASQFQLTAAQQNAVARLTAAARSSAPASSPFLLRGVTGSGKTLVYIELLKEVVQRQRRGAIVLVPEISLTPQTVARFRAEFGDVIAVLHSALSDGERFDAWRALHTGEKRVAIGARSAVFAPVKDLGAIILDEEHEASYKQSESPRYHARDLAVIRARLTGAVCLLGSATPSLESWHNVRQHKFELLELPERVEGRPLPPVEVVDLRNRPSGASSHILSDRLIEAVWDRLHKQEQTILLLNRRGYATFVQCRSCGEVWHCHQCNVSLTYHRGRRRLVCHYCFHEEPAPTACPRCTSGDLSFKGVGTEQVEREVVERFPQARIARMDVDTTSAKWAHHDILGRVERREVDILLGTQMIAKGLDFPFVTLVGVVNADVAMNLPDFRASERTFQLLTQVAGRAGRGERGGEVIVQTSLPHHYAIRCAIEHDYLQFAEKELAERARPQYPPHVRLVNVLISGTAEGAVQEEADRAADWVRGIIDANARGRVVVTGPAPCPIDRIRGRWRWHFLLRSGSAKALGLVCRHLQYRYDFKPGNAELRLIIDRDPVSLL
ncbi:MAG TPA: primosomal protein N' [Longimicrobiales bacterium]|nr:primosomal protein N' [Longimicrobiales bacterium]